MNYYLTIAIPTYNRAIFLFDQLTNLCHQVLASKHPIEILVSDNCSEDNTNIIVNQLMKEFNFINYIKQEKNLGLDGNIISCYENSKGKYIWFLSDDDVVFNHTVNEVFISVLRYSPSVFVFSFCNVNDECEDYQNRNNNTYREYSSFSTQEGIEDFFKVIMISTLVVKKVDIDIVYLKSCPFTIFPQITLSLMILKNNFKFMVSDTKILLRNPGYVVNDFFELYCINPRLAIKNAKVDKLSEQKLLKFTEKSLKDFVKLSIFERMGYYQSKVRFSSKSLKKSIAEYGFTLSNTLSILLIYLISKTPKSLILLIVMIVKSVQLRSIIKGFGYRHELSLHIKNHIEKAKSSDV